MGSIRDDILKLQSLGLLDGLLLDRTTGRRILWATDAYADLGPRYGRDGEMAPELITGAHSDVIRTRARKALEQQSSRTRRHGEVATPLWVCRKMCGHADEMWNRKARWQRYVDRRVLEIACGEAPFLVSRYDAVTGEAVPVADRVGLLDRKLRAVSANTRTEEEWLKWALRAFHAAYGYELQGDNLLIARVNLLETFGEYLLDRWGRSPTEAEWKALARIISWNLWQMDGLRGVIPCGTAGEAYREIDWFGMLGGDPERDEQPRCLVRNWTGGGTVDYLDLPTRGKRAMKFDFVIGNPPYQEELAGTSDKPVYNYFMDSAFHLADKVELITPARFLFNAGKTPKAWNEKMLSDPHLKVLYYTQDSSAVFPSTDIKGGIAITYRDAAERFGAIGIYTAFPELNSIKAKVVSSQGFSTLDDWIVTQNRWDLEALYADHPEYRALIGSGGRERRLTTSIFSLALFREERREGDVQILGLINNRRVCRYLARKYLEASHPNLEKWKVILPKSNGTGALGEVLSTPLCGGPLEGYTQSFIGVGAFDTRAEAENCLKYIKTKFARTCLGVSKITQDNNKGTWKYVPLQDFTPASGIDWTRSIPEIDRQLYARYGLDEAEIRFIEGHAREMT